MSGIELKAWAKQARLKPNEICAEAGISIPTLYKVYNGKAPDHTEKVEAAIRRLRERAKESLEAG